MDARNDGESVGDLIAQGRVSVDGLVETSVLPLATLGAYNVDLPAAPCPKITPGQLSSSHPRF